MKYFTILLLLALATADNFYFRRILQCVRNNTIKCTQWNQSTTLTYSAFYSSFCFSENTYVQTREGPKAMKDLNIHDEILSYDPETGKQGYSQVVAWLHRDVEAIARYDSIKTKEGAVFEASDYHNIAFVNSQGKIQFKFAKDLTPGDQLVGFPETDPHVQLIANEGHKKGLYSPFTEAGNFYIFDQSFNPKEGGKTKPMILVHVLSQVSNPNSEIGLAKKFISVWGKVGWNAKPESNQRYTHPLISTFSFIFGRNWVGAKQQVLYEPHHDQAHPSSFSKPSYTPSYSSRPTYPSYSSPSYSSYSNPSYSSYSSPSYSYSNPSYSSYSSSSNIPYYAASSSSSSYSRQRDRQNRMKAVGLAVSIVQETPLL